MTVTEVYDCKAALIGRLKSFTATGLPLAGVQVEYFWTGRAAGRELVYAGGAQFTRRSAGHDGHSELWLESATVGLYVRVRDMGSDVEAAENRCKAIGREVESLLQAEPRLPGNFTFTSIVGGSADYWTEDESAVAALAYRIQFEYYLD